MFNFHFFHLLRLRLSLSLSLCLLLSLSVSLFSQTPRDASVELSADVQSNPPRIHLHWVSNQNATKHFVYRKLKNSTSWGALMGNLSGQDTTFTDTTVSVGVSYEYRVLREAPAYSGYGYINAGIEVDGIEQRGGLILVVDETFSSTLRPEISRLISDMEGDGWTVKEIPVARNARPSDVKAQISTAYNQIMPRPKALFLLGHVPVPYSGDLAPDGHTDHIGAWPADVYYADINGTWTDVAVNDTLATGTRNDNIPGDGKFDQSLIPSDVELQTGRVDFANLPSFASTEEELLRKYLDKNHDYRHKEFSAVYRGLIDDNFGWLEGGAFAASGYKNFGPLVSPGNVIAGDYFTGMADSSYLWSYGCGGGWYQGAGGVGSTGDFANSNLKTIFTFLFGSYFGDWDSDDNFLRAALAQGLTLTNAWSGRPHWIMHHMAMGENIGYSTRLTQNNNALYFSGYGARFITVALMGDPTLRNDVIFAPKSVNASVDESSVTITWQSGRSAAQHFHLYKRNGPDQPFERVNAEPVTDLIYVDECVLPGNYDYMVRAEKLQETPSGSYWNLSQGITAPASVKDDFTVQAGGEMIIFNNTITFVNLSTNADAYLWIFGDGESSDEPNPVHEYEDGDYTVTLIATNECDADTFYIPLSLVTGTENIIDQNAFSVSPNPAEGKIFVEAKSNDMHEFDVNIFNAAGLEVFAKKNVEGSLYIDGSHWSAGNYNVVIRSGKKALSKKLAIQ